ncbi:two-component system, cell cycle sensor histidine kinase PleC [uncultured Gammaproteobacteria bacterium]
MRLTEDARLIDLVALARAFETSPVGVIVAAADGRIVAVNRCFCQWLGYENDELLGLSLAVITHQADWLWEVKSYAQALAGAEALAPVEKRYLRKDRRPLWVRQSLTTIHDDDGRVVGSLLRSQPISSSGEEVEEEEPAGVSDALFRQLYDMAGDAAFVVDAVTGVILDGKGQVRDLLGLTTTQVIGLKETELHPPEQAEHYRDLFAHRANEPERQIAEGSIRHADGSAVPVEIVSIARTLGRRRLMLAVFKDITERRRTEQAVLAFANRMTAILSSMFDAVITADQVGTIGTFNDAAERLFGWRAYEAVGRNVRILMPSPMSEEHDGYLARYQRGGPARVIGREREVLAQRKDGTTFPIELSVTEIQDRSGRDGKTDGCGRSFVAVIRDITEQKRAEAALLAAKSQAELANRSKGEFLANMSHELRTPLNAIIGFSEILAMEMFGPLSPRYVEYASTIFDSGQHLLGIINDLLDMSRIDAGMFELSEEPVDVVAVVSSCLSMVKARADNVGVELVSEVGVSLPYLVADRRAVMQILLNLLSNAIKFTPRGGRVMVVAAKLESGELTLSVSDTGIGIAGEVLPHIFEPFQQADSRLSRKHEGTGLGLSISKNLMELHGGALDLASEPGQGTTATMRFPAARVHGQ